MLREQTVLRALCCGLIVTAVRAGSLNLEAIDGAPFGLSARPVVEYTPHLISGTLEPTGLANSGSYAIEAAWRTASNEIWRVIEQNAFPVKSGRIWKWSLTGVRLGEIEDYDTDLELVVFLVPRDRLLGSGPFTTSTLQQAAISMSEIVQIRRAARISALRKGPPELRLRRIGEQFVHHGPEYNVSSREIAELEQHGAEAGYPFVFVQPQGAEGDRWVMPYGAPGKGDLFYSDVYYGREGMDQWIEFLTYAGLLRQPIQEGRITSEEWNNLMKSNVIVLSPVIRVRRIDRAFDERTQIRLEITKIQSRDVDKHVEAPVPSLSVIEGRIEGRPITLGEEISVFGRPNDEGAPWKYWGRAIILSPHEWQLPPVELGPAGRRLAIYATASRGRPQGVGASNIFAESQRYHVVISADVRVRILSVGRLPVAEGQPVSADRMSNAEVELSAPSLRGREKVWMYARETGTSGSWKLLRRATQKEGRIYQMFPSVLSEKDTSLWLIAVVADAAPPNLDDRELATVIAFSKPVRVNIE